MFATPKKTLRNIPRNIPRKRPRSRIVSIVSNGLVKPSVVRKINFADQPPNIKHAHSAAKKSNGIVVAVGTNLFQ